MSEKKSSRHLAPEAGGEGEAEARSILFKPVNKLSLEEIQAWEMEPQENLSAAEVQSYKEILQQLNAVNSQIFQEKRKSPDYRTLSDAELMPVQHAIMEFVNRLRSRYNQPDLKFKVDDYQMYHVLTQSGTGSDTFLRTDFPGEDSVVAFIADLKRKYAKYLPAEEGEEAVAASA